MARSKLKKGEVPFEPAPEDSSDADLAADNQPKVEIAPIAKAPIEPAKLSPAIAAMVEEEIKARVQKALIVPVVRKDTRDQEVKMSVAELNKRHMDEKRAIDAKRNEEYEKGIVALQRAYGVAPGTPVPVTLNSAGHQVIPLASPYAKQLAAENLKAAQAK